MVFKIELALACQSALPPAQLALSAVCWMCISDTVNPRLPSFSLSHLFPVSVGYEYESCPDLILWEKRTAVLQGYEIDASKLGGWSLDKHHALNIQSGELALMDGIRGMQWCNRCWLFAFNSSTKRTDMDMDAHYWHIIFYNLLWVAVACTQICKEWATVACIYSWSTMVSPDL